MDPKFDKSLFLPTTREELKLHGWEQPDVILFSGDAYIDHPSFGTAVIGRVLQAAGYKVAIVPQPNWRDDLRDFKKLGKPRLFFGVTAGAMDSMVNHYTANRRLRHDDAYTPGGKHGMRPNYPTIVYSNILKDLFPDVPVIAGGIEASMRRLAHYDYWEDKLLPSIILPSKADLVCYGMGEKTMLKIAERLDKGESIERITDIPQTVLLTDNFDYREGDIVLNSYESAKQDKRRQAENFRAVEIESNKWSGKTIWQKTKDLYVKVNPMWEPWSTEELDRSYDLPYTRLPHPRYKGKTIPAYEMIKHSVTMHRGCFGGCSFCTISAHQGKFIASRSKESIMKEVDKITRMEDFKGYISDLGGPSANMYKMGGKNPEICKKCVKPSCLFPSVCKNLNTDHSELIDIYRAVDSRPEVKKSFIGSGVRYDLAMSHSDNPEVNKINRIYIEELIKNHVSGRLKVAPEHTSKAVLDKMRKPSFSLFVKFKKEFDRINNQYGLKQQLIPYFISSHPGCRPEDMAELAVQTKNLDFHLEQVQDFTPTPMTHSTEMFYTGFDAYTNQPVYVARTDKDKVNQRKFFFWYKPENRRDIIKDLRAINRPDLEAKLFSVKNKNDKKNNSHKTGNSNNQRHYSR